VKRLFAAVTAGLVALVLPVTATVFLASPSSGGVLVPSGVALDDIPGEMLALYQHAAATRCPGLPWPVLAAVGKVETNHARNVAVSSAGALGPMQFMPGTWAAYGVDADGDGVADVWNPVDAVHGAAHYLCATGGGQPATLRDAIWAYNHADWYVELVLEHARRYAVVAGNAFPMDADVSRLLANPRLVLTPRARADLENGLIDPRVVAVLGALAERHVIGVSVLRSGHTKYVAGTNRVSNHYCGQAADIWMIDGQPVSFTNGAARMAAEWIAVMPGPLRANEVGTPWPDLREHNPGFFSDRAHQGHLHVGFGPRCADI
jgi:hypothetical protein